MKETTPRIQRIYLRFSYPGAGMMKLHASLVPPAYDEPLLVLLSRGVMPLGQARQHNGGYVQKTYPLPPRADRAGRAARDRGNRR